MFVSYVVHIRNNTCFFPLLTVYLPVVDEERSMLFHFISLCCSSSTMTRTYAPPSLVRVMVFGSHDHPVDPLVTLVIVFCVIIIKIWYSKSINLQLVLVTIGIGG